MKRKIRITILSGGPSSERAISILTGRQIAQVLPRDTYTVSLLILKKQGKEILAQLKQLKTDLAFIAMHGKFGEDGTLQAMLETLRIRYTGSGVLASAWAIDKVRCLRAISQIGVRTPHFFSLSKHEQTKSNALKQLNFPCVILPGTSGSSIGVSIVKAKKDLAKALRSAFAESEEILIEQYIKGREFSCAVLGNRNTKKVVLPSIEIITHQAAFFDYHAKYFSKTVEEICPAPVTKKIENSIRATALAVHEFLGCDGLTRSDFILSETDGKIYFLEINTVPGQTKMSLAPKEAAAAGMDFPALVQEQIRLALQKP